MISSIFRASRPATRGFTLTEIAIVLGIIGIILGAIWAAAAMVYENNRTKTATEQTLAIINNWRSVYGSRRVDVADGVDMTQLTVNNSFEPEEMMPGSCVTTGGTAACYLNGPWASQVRVQSYQNEDNAIAVQYSNLSITACNHYANSIVNAAGLVATNINGTVTDLPPLGTATTLTTSQVSTQCNVNGLTNSVIAIFSMN